MMKVEFELTDTFAGESNYSWVKKEFHEFDDTISNYAIIRKAKQFAGLNGIKCRKEELENLIALYPQGICMVLFISFYYE